MSNYVPQSLAAISADAATMAVMRANIAAQMLAAMVVADPMGKRYDIEHREEYAVQFADDLMRELYK